MNTYTHPTRDADNTAPADRAQGHSAPADRTPADTAPVHGAAVDMAAVDVAAVDVAAVDVAGVVAGVVDVGVVDVVVVGGGIAGLAAAYALARTGHTVRVLERTPFTETGAGLQLGLQLAPNATRILHRWGLLDEITRHAVQPRRWVIRDAIDGTELTHLDLADVHRRYRAPYLTITGHALHTILLAACRDAGVDLIPDTAVTGIHPTTGGVDAAGGGGGCAAAVSAGRVDRARVAVIADGIWSRLRRLVDTDPPRYQPLVAYRALLPTADLYHPPPHDAMHDRTAGVDLAGLGGAWPALDEIVLHIGALSRCATSRCWKPRSCPQGS